MTRIRLIIIYLGLLEFLGAFPIIVWNEGHFLHIAQSLEFVQNIIISVPNSSINPANNGKLVYVTGMTTSEKLTDPLFEVNVNAVTLMRKVTMYQNTMKYDNGTYGNERWTDEPSDFPDNKNKPSWLFPSQTWHVKEIKVGAYYLPSKLVSKIPSSPVSITKTRLEQLQTIYRMPMRFSEDGIYAGKDPDYPDIGDMKISITTVLPQQVSIIAKQQGHNLEPYSTPMGEDIFLLYPGHLSAAKILSDAQQDNIILAWFFRLGALILMYSGLKLLRTPLEFLAKSIPILGRLLSFSMNLAAFVVTFILTMATIVLSWIAYKSFFISITLLIVIIISVGFHFYAKKTVLIKEVHDEKSEK